MGKGTKFRLKHRIDLKQQNPCDIALLNRETKTRVGTTKAKYKDTLPSYEENFILSMECIEMRPNKQILTGGPWVPGRPGVPGGPLLPCQIV